MIFRSTTPGAVRLTTSQHSISFIFNLRVTTVGYLSGCTTAVFTRPSTYINGHFLAGIATFLAPTCVDLKFSIFLKNHGFSFLHLSVLNLCSNHDISSILINGNSHSYPPKNKVAMTTFSLIERRSCSTSWTLTLTTKLSLVFLPLYVPTTT